MEKLKYSSYDTRTRAIQAFLKGVKVPKLAEAFGTHRATIYRWIKKYNAEKCIKGLVRKIGSGRPRRINFNDTDFLRIILNPASKYGFETDFWTCRRIKQIIEESLKISISKWTIWRRLKEAGLTYQKPERKYFEANVEEREKWKRYEIPKIKRTVKKYKAILYCQDESNISLTAVLGKTWSPRGKTPQQVVTGKRGGVSAMSAVSGSGSLIFTLHEKRIASDEIIEFLRQMLKHHKRRHLVVIMDQAPPHTSKKTRNYIKSQKRLHVFYLPKYSPDWNPDEKVWNYLKNHELKGHKAKTKEEIKVLANEKLEKLSKSPSTLRGIFFRCFVADLLH